MAELIGIGIKDVRRLLTKIPDNLVCEVANYNSLNQIVISGDTKAIDNVIKFAKEKKIKAIK